MSPDRIKNPTAGFLAASGLYENLPVCDAFFHRQFSINNALCLILLNGLFIMQKYFCLLDFL